MKNFENNELCKLFSIRYPIIQAGMVWVSGAKLAAASANAGILGIIGAGSMGPELLQSQIEKAKLLTNKPIAVNIPLLYSKAQEQIQIALDGGIRIFFTSAGSPKKWTKFLKDQGCIVVHVTSSPELAIKCEDAGVDAIVAEGFEAGGHNGREEITTMCLIPQVVDVVKIPVIAAGGIIDGRQIAAAFCLGAKGVQMGTRFVATVESSAHQNFKQALINSNSDSTRLMMKKLVPVRLMKNKFFTEVEALENQGASASLLEQLLGKGRAKKGMYEGDLENGELEIGQGCSMLKEIPSVADLIPKLINEMQKIKA